MTFGEIHAGAIIPTPTETARKHTSDLGRMPTQHCKPMCFPSGAQREQECETNLRPSGQRQACASLVQIDDACCPAAIDVTHGQLAAALRAAGSNLSRVTATALYTAVHVYARGIYTA